MEVGRTKYNLQPHGLLAGKSPMDERVKIFISRIEVNQVPIYVEGRWGSLREKLSLLSPRPWLDIIE